MRDRTTNHGRDAAAARTAREQHGLITYAQAFAIGFTRSNIDWRVRTGRWLEIFPTVYCIDGAPSPPMRLIVAAQLWCGPESAVSHETAAFIWGLRGFRSADLHVSTTERRRPNGLPIVVHRVDDLLIREIVAGNPPVTSMRRTLLDLVGGRGYERVEGALDQALREQLVTAGQLWLMLDEPRLWGRRGVARLRDLLAVRLPGEAPTDSDLELLGIKVLTEGGLPPPKRQHPITLLDGVTIHADLAYPEATLAIECDSYGFHMDRHAFEADRERDLATGLVGWKTLRFTWAMLKWQPRYVIETVSFHYEARRGPPVQSLSG